MKPFLSVLSTVLVAFVTLPTALLAHEGHGLEATVQSLLHWASSPFHAAVLVVVGALLLGVALFAHRVIAGSKAAARVADKRCVVEG